MLSYDKRLKALSQHLRKNMTDAENMLWLKSPPAYRRQPHPSLPVYDRKRITKEGERKARNVPTISRDRLDFDPLLEKIK